MASTMELLELALAKHRAAEWARALNLHESTLSQAKKRGRLSPTLAAAIAIELGENPQHWGYVAALEAEPETPLLDRLKQSLQARNGRKS